MSIDFYEIYKETAKEKTKNYLKPKDGDYRGDDGLLYCGKCHKPKQAMGEYNGAPDLRTIPCDCRIKEKEQREEQERREKAKERRRECFGTASTWQKESTFEHDRGYSPEVTSITKKYVENFNELSQEGFGLLLYGSVGGGKSFHGAAVANALIDAGYRVKATTFGELYREDQSVREKNAFIRDLIQKYDLIMLDDLGTEQKSEAMKGFVFSVIDALYKSKKPFIVTTNISEKELMDPADDAYKRIYERILERCPKPIKVENSAGSARRQRLRENGPKYRKLLGID